MTRGARLRRSSSLSLSSRRILLGVHLFIKTARGSDDGWLALDRNGNGLIDDGTELFGTYSPQIASDAANGFESLHLLDADSNGLIDSADPTFGDLLVWVDADHDAVSDLDELERISELGIVSLHLDYAESSWRDLHENWFRFKAELGLIPESRVGPVMYDVGLVPLSEFSQSLGSDQGVEVR